MTSFRFPDGKSVSVNAARVTHIYPTGTGTVIVFAPENIIEVEDDYADVLVALSDALKG